MQSRVAPEPKKKPAESKRLDLPQRAFRTAIGNGSAVLDGVDGRTLVARRFREIGAAIAIDLGGESELTEAQKQLVRSVAGLVALRERLDVQAAKGEPIDSGEYCRISNSLRRCLATIGLHRVPKNVGPTLSEVLRGRSDDRAGMETGIA
jgi:hypothetical protein